MIKDEPIRESIPEQRNRARELLLGRAALTFGFTGAQVWAASILIDLELTGTVRYALVLVLAAAFIAALDGWREIWTLFRTAVRDSSTDCGGDVEPSGRK
ncbi:hypothetical protein MOQ72_12995 [Saccharopolyspora sp. K220]|uniref:hypothetical protein n=1 Tax=Saccharopolyspora soli TaxID=2926618 RepID=UPI001F574719|nr:hypothetical protein [Saccharopolyspora soli]MCI2418348.1 hypothetical protein [Saccharopolyspora soli]